MKIHKLLTFVTFMLYLPGSLADLTDSLRKLTEDNKLRSSASVKTLYSRSDNQPIWSHDNLRQLIRAIETSDQHGLIHDEYHLDLLKSPKLNSNLKDVLATDAWFTLARQLMSGKLDPVALEPGWNFKRRGRNLSSHFEHAIATHAVTQSLEVLSPSQPTYRLMKQQLTKLLNIKRGGSWPLLREGITLKPGDINEAVVSLKRRLWVSGDLQGEADSNALFDYSLMSAVKSFQRRHSLEADGIVGPDTLRELNKSIDSRIEQLRVNMERWRWLPDQLGQKHIRINIADFRLEAFNENSAVAVHEVVVGRFLRQTPVFSSDMTFMVLNPWWDIPTGLAKNDILPTLQADPKAFIESGYQVLDSENNIISVDDVDWGQFSKEHFPYRMRQKPGDKNSMGRVKFIFPNQYSVYLHDTASPELFDLKRRDLSSGCIRVQYPLKIVYWLLETHDSWPAEKIESVLLSAKPTRINLQQPVPVHLFYMTITTDNDHKQLRFLEDIYNRDPAVLAGLNQTS